MADYTSHEAPAQKATSLPVTVPPRLIGRDAILGQVYTRLRENKPVFLHGSPGIGKTALAATLAAAYTEQPGGVLWLNVQDDRLEQLIVRVGRAYQVREIIGAERPIGMVGAVVGTLNEHKPLIVLDGQLNELATLSFIERCVNNLPMLLVNSQPFGDESWSSFKLEPLAEEAAGALLRAAAQLPDDPSPAIDQIVQALHGVPMALALAGSAMRATKQTPSHYLDNLSQIPGSNNADPSLVALTVSFRGLNNALQGLLLMMGAMFRGEATAALLSKVGNAPQETIQQVMRLLAHQHLLEQTERYGTPYYRLHPLTHRFAQTLAGEQRLTELRGKIRDALVEMAQDYSSDADASAYNGLAAMMDNLIAAAEWAAGKNNLGVANQVSLALMQTDDFVNERGYVYELLRLRDLASTSTTPFPAFAGDQRPEAIMAEMDEGEDDFDIDDYDEDEDYDDDFDDDEEDEVIANRPQPGFLKDLFDDDEEDDDLAYEEDDEELEGAFIPEVPDNVIVDDSRISEGDIEGLKAALLRARQKEDNDRQLALLEALGKAQVEQGLENEAISTYDEIVDLFEDRPDDESLLDALDSLAALMVKTDNAQPAILHANRGIQLAQQFNDDDTQMHMYCTLGDARQQLGESAAAVLAYSQALEIARNNDDRQNEAIVLFKLGYAQLDNSDAEGASHTWEQALPLFREQEKRDYEGKVLGALGTAYGELDRWSESVHFHTSALHIARDVGDKEEELLQLSDLAYAAVQAEDLGQAVLRYRQALHLAYESDDRENIVSTIVDLAGLLVKSPHHLALAKLLIDDALQREPNDRDVRSLSQRIASEILVEEANGVRQKPVTGTVNQYAANAYKLLEV